MNRRELCLGGATRRNFVPARAIDAFSSRGVFSGEDFQWLTCCFSPCTDHLLFMGDDDGVVGVVDAVKAAAGQPSLLKAWSKHRATVFGLAGVPGDAHRFLSVSGDMTARLWDVETGHDDLFVGHQHTIRCAAFSPDYVFASGSRDGSVLVFDRRVSAKPKTPRARSSARAVGGGADQPERTPVVSIFRAHDTRLTALNAKGARVERSETPSITSLVFSDEHTVISSSDLSKSGLRMWDLRKVSTSAHPSPMSILNVPTNRNSGVTSICLDRYRSSLFTAVTGGRIFEYSITSALNNPVGEYLGAQIHNFYHQVVASPTSDHLMCGSQGGATLIWDLQVNDCLLKTKLLQEKYSNCYESSMKADEEKRLPFASYCLRGHGDVEVMSIGWSCNGRYIVTMDEYEWRIWDAWAEETRGRRDDPQWAQKQRLEAGREFAERLELTDFQKEEIRKFKESMKQTPIRELRRTLRPPPKSETMPKTPTRTKRPFAATISPLKEIQNTTPKKSPAAKVLRFSPRTPKTPSKAPTELTNETPKKSPKKPLFNPFYAKYPTEKLPRWVEIRRRRRRAKKLEEMRQNAEAASLGTPSTSTQRREKMEDFWKRTPTSSGRERLIKIRAPTDEELLLSSGTPACARMPSLEERLLAASPRKLVIKQKAEKRSSKKISDFFKVIPNK